MKSILAITLLTSAVFAADDAAITAFRQRVNQYVKIRDAVSRKVPALPKAATPEQIQKYETALAAEIRTQRSNAKPGDVFVPEVRPLFLRILKDNFSGTSNRENRAVAREGNPEVDREKGESAPAIRVNAVYPKDAPLSSVPPLLLLQLPKLPKDIEYRFSGPTLLLWDNVSNLIIDFMKGAAPGL